jgi:phosphoserine phosphatase
MRRLPFRYFSLLLSLTLTGLLYSCNQPAPRTAADKSAALAEPLPSWQEGNSKQDIIAFVTAVRDPASPDYVPPADRIAVFDNDGTLWAEQPLYFQFLFALDRVKQMAPDHPEWKTQQPFQAILENDLAYLKNAELRELAEIVMTTHAGITPEAFEEITTAWLDTARHQRFDHLYRQCVYQPMLEVLDYLRAHDFKTFIVSGGGIEFIRAFSEEAYGIPPEQVVGSSIKTEFRLSEDGGADLIRLPEIDFIDDKEGKPVGIRAHIGQRPIAAFGNSDGDLAMLQYTDAGPGRQLMVIVHHDDATREYAYDRESHIGHLDKALDEANEKGWTVVSMKNAWKEVFPVE